MRCGITAAMETMIMMKNIIKTYKELTTLSSYEERFEYLKLNGTVGKETFGFARYINQSFYHSSEWLRFRDKVIIRDNGCDLGVIGHEIIDSIIIHHINPITYNDIVNMNKCVFDMNNVICTRLSTHNAIHYGDGNLLIKPPVVRKKNDTCPWRRN